ncbi:MAG: hypothetical protein KIT14_08305 [bacterium]|nr:hypothetical protein [bacterium]
MRRGDMGRTLGVLGAAGVLLLAGAGTARAAAEPGCGPRATLLRIEEKLCPANDRRPAIVRQRACCLKPGGQVRCAHFQHCPRNSPS